jgi:hypothetical protein
MLPCRRVENHGYCVIHQFQAAKQPKALQVLGGRTDLDKIKTANRPWSMVVDHGALLAIRFSIEMPDTFFYISSNEYRDKLTTPGIFIIVRLP